MATTQIRNYRVSQGCSISLPSGVLAEGGKVVNVGRDGVTPKLIQEWMNTGYLEEGSVQLEDNFTPNVPGVDVKPLPGLDSKAMNDGSGGAIPASKAVKTSDGAINITGGAVKTSSSAKPKDPTSGSGTKWNLDPSILSTKTLDQLNVLLAERDSAVSPFETKEEAVAFLSQSFR